MGEATTIKKALCMWCHDHCSVGVHVSDGQLVKVEENRTHPRHKALARVVRSCPRARAAAEWFYHPERLTYPLKRKGDRGEGKWQRISWEQALDEIAERLERIARSDGPEAIANHNGTARTHNEYATRFFTLLGSPNLAGQASICFGPANLISSAIAGWPCNFPLIVPGVTKCVLLMGSNPAQSWRGLWFSILEAQKQGAKLISIDPRRTGPGERADLCLQLRPGTDTALMMAMINEIIEQGMYDRDFVERWCYGFDDLRRRAHDYPLEKAAEITWVPAEMIREGARLFATNRPAATLSFMGLEHLSNSTEALQARYILSAITGNLDVEGANPISSPPHPNVVPLNDAELDDMVTPEQKRKTLGADRFKLLSWPGYDLVRQNQERMFGKAIFRSTHCLAHAPTLFRAILSGKPYPVKALINTNCNPIVTSANARLVYQALREVELHVVGDMWLTPTAQLADYVLPIASWLERPSIWEARGNAGFILVGEEALPPTVTGQYERRTDYDLWRGLGVRMGQESYWPWQNLERAYDYRLAPLGYTLKKFMAEKGGWYEVPLEYRRYEKSGFATPTGKVELRSTIFEKLGYDPLPRYEEPAESPVSTPDLAKEYPFVLTTGGRVLPYYHSEHRHIKTHRQRRPDPIVQINPDTASRLGIGDGDWVWIETTRGRVKQKCQCFKGIDARVIHAEHAWWFPEKPGEEPGLYGVWESNINVLTEDDAEHCNKMTGVWPLRALLCNVRKVESD